MKKSNIQKQFNKTVKNRKKKIAENVSNIDYLRGALKRNISFKSYIESRTKSSDYIVVIEAIPAIKTHLLVNDGLIRIDNIDCELKDVLRFDGYFNADIACKIEELKDSTKYSVKIDDFYEEWYKDIVTSIDVLRGVIENEKHNLKH